METKSIASEGQHWYDRAGNPVYEVPRAKGDGMRPTNLADARKLSLVPSVTLILGCAAKPGLDVWKLRQMFEVAYTTPRIEGESDDDFYGRVVIESKEKARLAAEKGVECHGAIEQSIRRECFWEEWSDHTIKVYETLNQYGIDLFKGKPEHSFASPLGFGGKIDWHNDEIVMDFKTRQEIDDKKRLAYDEHVMQLSAYANGLQMPNARCLNVFISIDSAEVRIVEHSRDDIKRGWQMFSLLLRYWKLLKNYE